MPHYVDDFFDYEDRKVSVNWNKKTWDEHLRKHPELIDLKNTSRLIKETILKPSKVMSGFNPEFKKEFLFCYYKETKRHQQIITCIKVVVGCQRKTFYVKSVMQKTALNYLMVKEEKYNNFKEI